MIEVMYSAIHTHAYMYVNVNLRMQHMPVTHNASYHDLFESVSNFCRAGISTGGGITK